MSSQRLRNGYKNKCLLFTFAQSNGRTGAAYVLLRINVIIYGVIFTIMVIMNIDTILIVRRSSSSLLTNSPLVNVWASQNLRLAADMGILL